MRRWMLGLVVLGGLALLGVWLLLGSGRSHTPDTARVERSPRASLPAPAPAAAPQRPGAGLRIRGTVVDPAGAPVAGARVSASWPVPGQTLSELPCPEEGLKAWYDGRIPPGAERQTLFDCLGMARDRVLELVAAREGEAPIHAEATTASDGTFVLEGLPEGPMALWVLSERGAMLHPGLPAGTEGVELLLEEGLMVAGTVLGDGAPLAGATVTVLYTDPTRFFEATTGADGRFRVGPLPRGSLHVIAAREGWLPTLEVAFADEKLEVTLHRPHPLGGRVLSGGAPVPGAEVRVSLGEDIPSSSARTVISDAQGRFHFVLPFSGPHTLSASHDGRYAVARVELGASPPPEVILEPGSALHVEGRVSDDARRPVAGARVSLTTPSGSSTVMEVVTGADGHFRMGPVEPGLWRFSLEADRYVDTRRPLERALTPGMGPVNLTLVRASSVTGRATDPEGKPLRGLELSLVRPGADGAPYNTVPQEKAWTDEDGRFVLDADAPGKYRVEVTDERFLDVVLPVRAPARDVHLTMRPGASVAGTVVDARGLPLEQFRVVLRAPESEDGPGPHREAHTDERGRFHLQGVKPGHYVLTASREIQGATRKASREVELGDGVHPEVELRLDAGRTLSGLVVDGAGKPLAGVYLRAHTPERGVLRIKEKDRGFRPTPPTGSIPTGPDGRFTLRHLTEAAYDVSAWKDGYTLVPERSTGAPLVEEQRFAVGPDTGPLHIVLERKPHIVGRVVGPDGEPLPRFTVHNLPVEATDGAFALPMEGGGTFFLVVRAEGLAPLALLVEQRMEGPDVDVGVLRMTEGRTVRGRVIDARTSAPVARAFLELASGHTRPTGLDYMLLNHSAAEDGTFELHHVDTRTTTLVVSAGGYSDEQRVPLDSAPEELTVRLVPARPGGRAGEGR